MHSHYLELNSEAFIYNERILTYFTKPELC